MLPAFLERVKPVSTIAKPACIKNTSAAPSSVQDVSMAEAWSANIAIMFVVSISYYTSNVCCETKKDVYTAPCSGLAYTSLCTMIIGLYGA